MGTAIQLIEKDSLRATASGYEFLVHLNWYRSLPLSSVVSVQLKLDGTPVDPGLISFGINDHVYKLDDLADQIEEFWFVQDGARLIIEQPGKIAPKETHTIEVELALRFPYIPIGPGKFLVNTTKYASTQIAA